MTGVRGEGPGYREHAPAPDLAPWIECFWTRGAGPAPSGAKTYRVLPDGRVFEQHVGYGPKKLARILRLRRTLRLIDSRGAANLAAVALDAGYYDQSHMNADFRDLAGCPPLASRDG
jgi:hypothetical protein